MNNSEREQWIDNDEGLYRWWKSSRLSKRQFIKENREEIDAAIDRALHPKQARYW
jgi:uridine kinase